MKAGRLKHRITFQRRTQAVNELSERLNSWNDFLSVWADVETLSGREFLAAQQVHGDAVIRVVARYSKDIAGVSRKDRIKHGEVYYDIKAIIDVGGKHTEVQMMCTQHDIS